MHAFKDALDRQWDVTINVSQLKAVKGLTGTDLYRLVSEQLTPLSELLDDPCALVDVLYALCRQQAQAASVTDEEFGRAMAGDALADAADAFVAELADFFPAQRRKALKKALETGRQVQALVSERALREVPTAEDLAEKVWQELRPDQTSNGSSGSSPAPSPSTPGP